MGDSPERIVEDFKAAVDSGHYDEEHQVVTIGVIVEISSYRGTNKELATRFYRQSDPVDARLHEMRTIAVPVLDNAHLIGEAIGDLTNVVVTQLATRQTLDAAR